MSYWKSYGRAPLAVRAAVALVITLLFLVVPATRDYWAYVNFSMPNIYDHDWARFLRILGFWPTWIFVGLVIWLNDRGDPDPIVRLVAKRRANLIVWVPAASGILCEVMKLLIRRERPDTAAGQWVFRPWSEHTFSTAGLSTPSSHTMVAFGAATILARLFPRARWVFYVLAWGCGVTRIFAHAHYLSDVTFGALLGWAIAWGIWIQIKKVPVDGIPAESRISA